jgi:VWFA-related protein
MTASAMSHPRLPFVCLAAIVAIAALDAQAPQPPAPAPAPATAQTPAGEQTPVFRAGVEVLPLDVVVLDRDGRQVTDLTSADFQIEVDGRSRRVATAEYIKLTDPVAASLARDAPKPFRVEAPDTGISTNNAGGPVGRAVLLLVDQGNIRFGAARSVMQNALKFVDRLQPNDRIAVVAVPGPGELVDFTTDHAKVREAMLRVTGRLTPVRRRFNVSITEAFAIYRQSDAMLIQQVIMRECAGLFGAADLERCERDVEQEAGEIVGDQRQQTDQSVNAIRAVLKSLGALEGQKSVILISEGLVLDGLGGDVDDLAGVAADVRASLDVLLLDVPQFDASQSQMPTTASADRALQEDGLQMLAGLARGTLHRVVATADTAFRRIEQALSGYYLLGVEPGANDRDGKRHRIDVKLTRRGLTVQARRAFLSPEGPPAATPEEAVKRTLRSPAPATALPLRLSTWTYKEPGTSRVRLIVAAEVQRGSAESLHYAAGLVVATKDGKVIAANQEPRELQAVEGDEGLAVYGGMVVLDPGTYRLRIALANAEKRVGSVEREVLAWQLNGDTLTLGDLLVAAEQAGSNALMPSVEPRVHNGSLAVLAEVYAPASSQAAEIGARLDVMRDEASRVLVSAPLQVITGESPEVRVAQGRVNVSAVPPGSYIARVSFTEGGAGRGALVRPFRVVATRITTTAGVPASLGVPPELVAAVLGSLPAASKDDVLDAPTTAALWTSAEQGRSPAVLAAIKTARGGQMMDGALAALSAGDQGVAAFVRGMDLLSQAKVDQAANQFQTAMRIQSGFGAARAMLGACLLIANREKEAAGLLMSVPATAMPTLARLAGEAWLRAGQPGAAVAPLEQATAAAPSDARTSKTLALAYALSGETAKGLPALTTYLDGPGSKDGASLAAGVFALYRRHAAGTDASAIAADKVKARGWARAYAGTKGPLGPIVEAWAGFLEGAK